MPTLGRLGASAFALALPLVGACASTGSRAASTTNGPSGGVEENILEILTPRVLRDDQYVEAAFRVKKDAYVVVFALDNDGRARMLFPASPDDSSRARANTVYPLPKFFAGLGAARFAMYGGSQRGAALAQSGGLIYAVASKQPLQLRRLSNESGEWNEPLIEHLTWSVTYKGVASAVGRALVPDGQDFDTSVSGFSGAVRNPRGLASLTPRGCDSGSSSPSGRSGTSGLTYTTVYVNGVQYMRLTSTNECGGSSVRWLPDVPGR
jgi:hypothetical protein